MGKFLDLFGTTKALFQIAIGGVNLKNSSGDLVVRNPADDADAALTASTVNVSGNSIVINSDAASTGSDYSITIARPTSGMSAAYTFTLPPDDGTADYVLKTDGNGNTSWAANSGATNQLAVDTTSLAFGSASTVSMFTLPANAVVQAVRVIVDTQFNGTPSLSIGISGTTSKYMSSTQLSLTAAGGTIFEVYPGIAASGSTEALIATYSAGSASAGAARIEVDYVIPS